MEKQEPVHWRALLDPSQIEQQLNRHMHITGFVTQQAAENWIAERLDFEGWKYSLQPLYAAPVAQAGQLDALDKQCRDDVARALGLTPQGDGYAWSALLADIKTAAKVAQAGQVPEGWKLVPENPLEWPLGIGADQLRKSISAGCDDPDSLHDALVEMMTDIANSPKHEGSDGIDHAWCDGVCDE